MNPHEFSAYCTALHILAIAHQSLTAPLITHNGAYPRPRMSHTEHCYQLWESLSVNGRAYQLPFRTRLIAFDEFINALTL